MKYIIDVSEDLSAEQIEEFENAVEASHGVIIERPKEFGSSKDNLRETALLEKITSSDFFQSCRMVISIMCLMNQLLSLNIRR